MRPRRHQDDAVAHGERLFLAVGDVDEGEAQLLVQVEELHLHVDAELLVQRAKRLVEEQDRGLGHQRPRQRHPLTLAAGELMDAAAVLVQQSHQGQRILRPLAAIVLVDTAHAQPVLDVLADRHVGEERVVLEHGRAVAPGRRDGGDVLAVDGDARDPGRALEPGDDPEQRRLAGAALAQQGEELAPPRRDRHVVERHHLAEAVGRVLHLQDVIAACRSSARRCDFTICHSGLLRRRA